MSVKPPDCEFTIGEVLFREGDLGSVMYVICEGQVRLYQDVDGKETTLAELESGDFVGAVGLVCDATQTATAAATAPTRCLMVDGPTLENMIANDVEISMRLIKGLASRLHATTELLKTASNASVAAAPERALEAPEEAPEEPTDPSHRVLMALIRYAEGSDEKDDDGVWIRKRLADIGKELEVDEKELAVVFKTLMRRKLIRIKRNGVLVPDMARMYEFMKSGDA